MIPRVCWMPAQGGLVNTRSSQRRLLHQLSMMCTFSVGIVAMAHHADLNQLEDRVRTLNAAGRTEFLLADPKPFVLQTSLDDFYVSYQINAYTKEANKQAVIYSELHANIQDCCFEVGIEILSPHYRAGRDGNMTTIPENYLGKDYKAPAFNVNIKGKD